jgi:hypothetical protein
MRFRESLSSIVVVLALVLSMSAAANKVGRQQDQKAAQEAAVPSVPPRELVRRVIENELKADADDSVHYMYKDRRQTPDGSKTKMMIETKQGTVAYLLAVNDKPLDQQQRAAENQRLQRLLSNPEEQQKKKKDQQQDNDRVTRMFRELPNAFEYKYEGMVAGSNGHEWVKLSFTPNPNYDPPSREASVFKAMQGTMLLDPVSNRLGKIEADLFREVNFGWGILGHLDKGGHFIVEQGEVGPNRWEPTYMNIQFTGKALLFKSINLRQIETTSDYVKVPDDLTLAQGVDLLKKHAEGDLAENAKSGR